MKKNVILYTVSGILLTLILFVGAASVIALQIPEKATHYHANFAVFVKNTPVDFAQADYMHLKPCKNDDDPSFHPRLENIHLHDLVGNVVHVHDDGLTWNDLFSALRYSPSDEAHKSQTTAHYYLNDKKVDSRALTQVVKQHDRLLITLQSEQLPDSVAGNSILENQMKQVGSSASEYDNPSTSNESCSGNVARSFQTRLRIGMQKLFSTY